MVRRGEGVLKAVVGVKRMVAVNSSVRDGILVCVAFVRL